MKKYCYFQEGLFIIIGIMLLMVVHSGHASAASLPRNECANPPAGTVFCEDFEGANPKADFDDYDGNLDTENQVITDSGPSGDSSNKLIRLRVPAGQSGTSDLFKVLPGSYDKLYARWYFKYETGFNFAARNHGGGLSAGDRNLIGQSGIQPTGAIGPASLFSTRRTLPSPMPIVITTVCTRTVLILMEAVGAIPCPASMTPVRFIARSHKIVLS